jgi:hypothetical protein
LQNLGSLDILCLFLYVWSWSITPENPSSPLAGNKLLDGRTERVSPEEETEGKALDEFVKKFHKQKGKEVNNGQ